MDRFSNVLPASVNWGLRLAGFALAVLVLASLLGASTVSAAPHAQPILLQLATTHPSRVVGVIVQKTVKDNSVEALVAKLGGTVTKDLGIINAFAAELQAKDLPQLARAAGVRWVSLDAPMADSGGPDGSVNTSALLNLYNKDIGADKVWAMGYQGSPVTVAVVDSGWTNEEDFRATPTGGTMRLKTRVGFNGNEINLDDHYGHGVHVMGTIGGNGHNSNGQYIGVAPKVNFVSVKVSDGTGQGTTSGVVQGLQWIYNNRATYNIKVVNMSINSSVAENYNVSPIDAALEVLWFNKIVVVVSAGNNGATGSGTIYPPANDPFVIAVGAVDDKNTAAVGDDVMTSWTDSGTTPEGFAKPDILAPGVNIIAPLSSGGAQLAQAHPDHLVNNTDYFRMSGTSMAAAVTTGGVALLLQASPNLTPDQVKYRLLNTPSRTITADSRSIPYLNIYNAVTGTTTQAANTNTAASQLLWTGSQPLTWGSVNWNSVNWNSVNWNSVNWNSVNWNSVNWNSDYWGQ